MTDKRDSAGNVVILGAGTNMKRPDGVPKENSQGPDCTSWQEKAHELACELDKLEQKITRKDFSLDIANRRIGELEIQLVELRAEYHDPSLSQAAKTLARVLINELWARIQAFRKWLRSKMPNRKTWK